MQQTNNILHLRHHKKSFWKICYFVEYSKCIWDQRKFYFIFFKKQMQKFKILSMVAST